MIVVPEFPVCILIHEPLVMFSQHCPAEEGSDKSRFGGDLGSSHGQLTTAIHLTFGKDLLAFEMGASTRNRGIGCTPVCLDLLRMAFNCWSGLVCQTAAEAAWSCAGNKPLKDLWLVCQR